MYQMSFLYESSLSDTRELFPWLTARHEIIFAYSWVSAAKQAREVFRDCHIAGKTEIETRAIH